MESYCCLDCGRIDETDPAGYRTYACRDCRVLVRVPRSLTRIRWLRWVGESASELTRLPIDFRASEFGVRVDRRALLVISRSTLLFETCEKIAVILAHAPTPYIPVSIELGKLECSNCGQRLTTRASGTNLELAWSTTTAPAGDPDDAMSRLVDYRPLPADEPRQLVRHFQNLAKHVDDRFSQASGNCAREPSEAHLLWDRTIDG